MASRALTELTDLFWSIITVSWVNRMKEREPFPVRLKGLEIPSMHDFCFHSLIYRIIEPV